MILIDGTAAALTENNIIGWVQLATYLLTGGVAMFTVYLNLNNKILGLQKDVVAQQHEKEDLKREVERLRDYNDTKTRENNQLQLALQSNTDALTNLKDTVNKLEEKLEQYLQKQ